MAKTPSSFTGPKRFLSPRKVLKRVPAGLSSITKQSIMCSSTLGPARPPSFVTWPTSTTDVCVCLAMRVSRAADSRTWVTLPGALVEASTCITWMESTIATRGACSAMSAAMASTRVSAAARRASSGSRKRCARSAICSRDSSPVT